MTKIKTPVSIKTFFQVSMCILIFGKWCHRFQLKGPNLTWVFLCAKHFLNFYHIKHAGFHFYAPMTMAGALSVIPVRPYVSLFKRRPLSKSNTFDQNFMKLGHIVLYHDVFFKFDNGPYRTMLSVVMALCLWKFTIWNDVRSVSWIFFIRILWNLVTLFSTMMSFSSSIMVHIAPCFQ